MYEIVADKYGLIDDSIQNDTANLIPAQKNSTTPEEVMENEIVQGEGKTAKDPKVHNDITDNNPVNQSKTKESDDVIFNLAVLNSDWNTITRLAKKEYKPAYIVLARHYKDSNPDMARKWAKIAINSGVNINEAEGIINEINAWDPGYERD